MTKSRVEKILFTALLLLCCLLFLFLTLPLGKMAKMVPIRVLVPTIVLLLLQLVRDWRAKQNILPTFRQVPKTHGIVPKKQLYRKPSERQLNISGASGNTGREYHILFLLVLIPALVYLFGFLFSAVLFICFYYRFCCKKSFWFSAAVSLGVAIFLYFAVIMFLGIDIKSGLIWSVITSIY